MKNKLLINIVLLLPIIFACVAVVHADITVTASVAGLRVKKDVNYPVQPIYDGQTTALDIVQPVYLGVQVSQHGQFLQGGL